MTCSLSPLERRLITENFMNNSNGMAMALSAAILCGSLPLSLAAQTTAPVEHPAEALQHDGQRDFDFLVGTWKIHLKRLIHSQKGVEEWVELDGTTDCRPVLNGTAEVEEFQVESRDKKMRIHGLAMRFYDPKSHQWSIWWANAKDGAMYPPPVTGEFKNGRGEFYDQEVVDGRTVFTRYVWTATTTPSPHFEQSISTDGGKSWRLWWVTDQVKDKS
jgi:hypothetical protein